MDWELEKISEFVNAAKAYVKEHGTLLRPAERMSLYTGYLARQILDYRDSKTRDNQH